MRQNAAQAQGLGHGELHGNAEGGQLVVRVQNGADGLPDFVRAPPPHPANQFYVPNSMLSGVIIPRRVFFDTIISMILISLVLVVASFGTKRAKTKPFL